MKKIITWISLAIVSISCVSCEDEIQEKAKEILLESEIEILITLGDGDGKATAWGCDLTYDYVKINGDYRT